MLDPAELGAHRVHALAHQLEVVGVDERGHALAIDEAAQGSAHAVEDALGLDLERAAENLLRQRECEFDGFALERLGQLLAQLGRPRRPRG